MHLRSTLRADGLTAHHHRHIRTLSARCSYGAMLLGEAKERAALESDRCQSASTSSAAAAADLDGNRHCESTRCQLPGGVDSLSDCIELFIMPCRFAPSCDTACFVCCLANSKWPTPTEHANMLGRNALTCTKIC